MPDLDGAAADYAAALAALEDAKGAIIGAVAQALAAGMSESEAARRAGVTRMTVRAWRRQRLGLP